MHPQHGLVSVYNLEDVTHTDVTDSYFLSSCLGGRYQLEIKIPETYPFNPPKVRDTVKGVRHIWVDRPCCVARMAYDLNKVR